MRIEIVPEPSTSLDAYAAIPISFLVDCILDVAPRDGSEGFNLRLRRAAKPYLKDYDAFDGGPLRWSTRYDPSPWAVLAAFMDGRRVGGAAVAFSTPEVSYMRNDLAVLWDIRVAPAARRCGIGSALFQAAEACAVARGYRELLAETQNVNVPACRFYARHGFVLRAANDLAYPELPGEIQLLWHKDL